jgi:prepilin-type N-terminal cleavage/methylation domain-containing protein
MLIMKIQHSTFNIQHFQRGFTLIELIIVIAILSILATTLIMTLNPTDQFSKALDAKRKLELSQVQKALESYYQDHDGKYPVSDSTYKIDDESLGVIDWGHAWGSYIPVLPKDPGNGKSYAYYSPDGKAYYIYASLDRATDPDVCANQSQGQCSSIPAGEYPCGGITNKCNFGVSSPNVNP